MKKILILSLNNDYGMIRKTKKCDYFNYFKYSNKNKIQKVFKKSILLFARNFFEKWARNVNDYEVFILFDNGFNKLISKYIKKKNPSSRVILWLWNPVGKRQKKFLQDKNVDEFWTYDLIDSKKYNLKFNTQFYNKELAVNISKNEILYSIMFIGNNKGRKETIDKYVKEFEKMKITSYINIIDNPKDNIKYTEYLEYLSKSKTILEIVNDNVSGVTLRALESIYFNKKLITNNRFIKNYDFYNPQNIFILEEDDIADLKKFINTKYVPIDRSLFEYYDFEEWIKRFL